jgi:hypothetical protein
MSSCGRGSPGVFSLCAQRGQDHARASLSLSLLSRSLSEGYRYIRMGSTSTAFTRHTIRHCLVLIKSERKELAYNSVHAARVCLFQRCQLHRSVRRASQKGTRTSITGHGSSGKARESERRRVGSNQICPPRGRCDGVKPNPDNHPYASIRSHQIKMAFLRHPLVACGEPSSKSTAWFETIHTLCRS